MRSDTAKVEVTVTPVNDLPVAKDDAATINEDDKATGNVLTNDTDADGDTLSASLDTGPSKGTLVFSSDGSFTYTPNANVSGTDSFTYTADDGNGGTDSATVTITINPLADAPVAKDDTATTDEDKAVIINVLANDSDADGDTLKVSSASAASDGTVTVNADGTITYDPDANFTGTDSFTYTITDGALTATAKVTITVTGVNDPPVAVDDKFTTAEDTKLIVAAPGVLAGDTDADGDPLTASLATGPTNGTVTVNGDGSFTYTPNGNFNGPDSFTYKIEDGKGGSDIGQVDISVTAVNDAPVAAGQKLTTNEDIKLDGTVTATDADGDTLTFKLGTGPTNGTLVFNSDGTFSYTPALNKSGTDSFTFTASDGTATSNVATIDITVTAVNDAPDAVDDKGVTDSDTKLEVLAPGILGNDTDPEGSALTVAAVNGSAGNVNTQITLPSGALLTVNDDGSYTYDPNGKFEGLGAGNTATDSFTYQATDGSLTDTATVKITITGDNEPPTATDDTAAVDADAPLTVAAPGVLGNDNDPDVFDTLVVSEVNGVAGDVGSQIVLASGAKLTLNGDGSYTYDPNQAFDSLPVGQTATDFFNYTVSDSAGEEDEGKVSITITGANEAPNVDNKTFSVAENSANGTVVGNVGATDPDTGAVLTYVLADSGGAFTIDSDGEITVADGSKIDFETKASYSLMVTVSDNEGAQDTATITINVTDVNDPPTVANPVADVTVVEESAPTVISIANVFADQDKDTLSFTVVSDNPGLVTPSISGTDLKLTYTANKAGTANVTLTADDGNGGTVSDVFVVNVTNVNDPVDAKDDSFSTLENKAVSGNVLANDRGPDPIRTATRLPLSSIRQPRTARCRSRPAAASLTRPMPDSPVPIRSPTPPLTAKAAATLPKSRSMSST